MSNKIKWIKYSEIKPEYGDLVGVYRDIESRQIYVVKWSEEEERYAEMNEITHWFLIEYPN